jgi:hypothetical protein
VTVTQRTVMCLDICNIKMEHCQHEERWYGVNQSCEGGTCNSKAGRSAQMLWTDNI